MTVIAFNGSGLFTKRGPVAPHLVVGPGGIAKEVNDLRGDLAGAMGGLAAIAVDEITNPAAATATALVLSAATQTTAQVLKGAGLTGALGPSGVLPSSRNITVTATAGSSSYAGSATVKGTDIHGNPQTEVIAITASTTVAGLKGFASVTEIDIPAQLNTSGAISVGFGAKLGLFSQPKNRAGGTVTAIVPFFEYVNGVKPTAGTVDGTNSTYSPNTAPDGAHSYAVYYDSVAT